jgi:hypothetical protein
MTPRQFVLLVKRHEVRLQRPWQHTASMMALYANCHRDPAKNKAFSPDDFNPFPASKPKQEKIGLGPEVFAEFQKAFEENG